MGATTSRGRDNQSLIDNLINNDHSLPPTLERVLRLVDRGDYFEEKSSRAYIDLPWRSGSLHLSAPGIYLAALKHLDIKPGHHFLNIGSGSGYFSTVIGLLLGYDGINHGIELEKSNVAFANQRLWSFLNNSDAPFERDFCIPRFVHGNIFDLVVPPPSIDRNKHSPQTSPADEQPSFSEAEEDEEEEDDGMFIVSEENVVPSPHIDDPGVNCECSSSINDSSTAGTLSEEIHKLVFNENLQWPLYDRIYVGAGIGTRTQLLCILSLLKTGGVLIAPVRDEFVKITRIDDKRMVRRNLLSISFAPLIMPSSPSTCRSFDPPPTSGVPSLLRQCGRWLRGHLRSLIHKQREGLPVLGRLKEIELTAEKKKRCDGMDSMESTSHVDSTLNNGDRPDSGLDSTDDSDGFVEPHSQKSGSYSRHFDPRNHSLPHSQCSTKNELVVDSVSAGGTEESRPTPPPPPQFTRGSLARVLHHLISRSTRWESDDALPSESDRSAEVNSYNSDHEANTSENSSLDASRVQPQQAPETESTRSPDRGVQIHIRMAEQVMAMMRASGNSDSDTEEEEEEETDPSEDEGPDDVSLPQSGTSRSPGKTEGGDHSTFSPSKRPLKREKPRRELRYQPPTYRYRDEMHRMLSEELNLPNSFIRAAFTM